MFVLEPSIRFVYISTLPAYLLIYGLSQLISEPTRITPNTGTLIDFCITNSPEKIVNSGVLHLGISDHSLVFMTRKSRCKQTGIHRVIETRVFKDFNKNQFLHDLAQQPWDSVNAESNAGDMWEIWKKLFMEIIEILKRQATLNNDVTTWQQHKHARNETNNAIRTAKQQYFKDNLEINKKNPRKTWELINELSSRKCGKTQNFSEIRIYDKTITSAPEMAEAFNKFFTTIDSNLAFEIPPTNVEPKSYLQPTDKVFSLKAPDVLTVCKLLSDINERKATGLDKILCKLLKLAGDIVGPSLTSIFKSSIDNGIFPSEWKVAKVTPIFKKGANSDLNNYRPTSVLPILSKIFEKIIYQQVYDYLNENKLLSNNQSGFRSLYSI